MLICGVFAMLERARQVLLPLGSTLTAVAPGAGGNILVGSEEGVCADCRPAADRVHNLPALAGIIYIVTPSGALQCVFATKSGTVTRICNHEALLRSETSRARDW